MSAVRNTWAHATTEEQPRDDVYRDLDTLQRFARIIGADSEFIDKIKVAKESVLSKAVSISPPTKRRPTRRLVRSANRATENTKSSVASRDVSTTRRRRDLKLEASLKASVGQLLKDELQEPFVRKGDSQFVFSRSGRRFLCKYSSFKKDQSVWFWGVSRKHWNSWGTKDHLILILENEAGKGYSYLLLDPQISIQLLKKCSESKGEKKINMRMYVTYREVRFQEWQELTIKDRIKPLMLTSFSL